jgi:hypothetical protein
MKAFEARRGEFATYADFINAMAEENPRVRALRESLGLAAAPNAECESERGNHATETQQVEIAAAFSRPVGLPCVA